jgi:hypothetical protein
MTSTSARPQADGPQVRNIPISSIRKDGQTQHRVAIDPALVAEYAERMQNGDVFPPVRVWWDRNEYWLSDGFHRAAAAEKAGCIEIAAEIRTGSVNDAQWDSFSANSCHGKRWSGPEGQQVIQLALAHPNATLLSNVDIAKYLHVSEKAIRRWRKVLSSAHAEDKVRFVTRGQSTYPISTEKIGQTRRVRRAKSREEIRTELALMREQGSPKVRRLLVIVGNWAFGSATPAECIEAMERVVGG